MRAIEKTEVEFKTVKNKGAIFKDVASSKNLIYQEHLCAKTGPLDVKW